MKQLVAVFNEKGPYSYWRIAINGIIPGDCRSYQTKELCEQAIREKLKKDARDAITYDRPLVYVADLPVHITDLMNGVR